MKSSSRCSATHSGPDFRDVRPGRPEPANQQRRRLLRLTAKHSRTYRTIERLQARIAHLLDAVQG